MSGDTEMQKCAAGHAPAPANTYRIWNRIVGTVKSRPKPWSSGGFRKVRQVWDGGIRPRTRLDGTLQNAELMVEREDLGLKRRTDAEGSEQSSQESRQQAPERMRRENGNSQFVNEIEDCESHRRA